MFDTQVVQRDFPILQQQIHGKPLMELPKGLFIPPNALEVFLENFQGPLDLLLYLIRKHNLEVLDIPMAELTRQYMAYVELFEDPEIDAIYNPLPNHMHLEWTEKAIKTGKHVLCEKPLVLKTEEVKHLMKLRDEYKVKVGEAFMVHTHPQWVDAANKIKNGELGKLKIIQGFFSYYNTDETNIRNIKDYGGGALWDIGCYPIHTSRHVFGEDPVRVAAQVAYDEKFGTDVLASVIMEFPSGQASFHVSTQLVPHQRMSFFGDRKRLDIEIPFNAPNYQPCRAFINEGIFSDVKEIALAYPVCDQYQVQGDAFSKAILEETEVPVPLENALGNIATIEAIFKAGKSKKWEEIKK